MSATAIACLNPLRVRCALACLAVVLAGCSSQPVDLDRAYRAAVQDAAIAEASEITDDLVAIRRDNPDLVWDRAGERILVATWKSRQSYEGYLKNADRTSTRLDQPLWVTAVPQLRQRCLNWAQEGGDALDLRIKQYLGLPSGRQYELFVQLWVTPERMFRPCVDPEVDDSGCELHFGDRTPRVTGIPDYRAYYRDLYYNSFRAGDAEPWTGLGYTYDWGDPNTRVGASEFILAPGTPYEIESVTPTARYCSTD